MSTLHNVTLTTKSNVYFDGKCVSHTVLLADGSRKTVGVAHRHLPCGTKVTLKYGGRYVRTKVIDRGPYATGIRWDLTQRTARKLHLEVTDTIRAAPIK